MLLRRNDEFFDITYKFYLIRIHHGSKKLWPRQILAMYAMWPWQSWPRRYDLGSRSWHTFRSSKTIVWNTIKIQHGSKKLRPGHKFWLCRLWPWPWDMTLAQGHDTTLGHWQQLYEMHILSRSNVVLTGLETHTCKLAKCELKFSFASWKYWHSKKNSSSIIYQ